MSQKIILKLSEWGLSGAGEIVFLIAITINDTFSKTMNNVLKGKL